MNHHSPLTILVIDDCAADREIYRHFLQHDRLYTYHIVEFETVTEAMGWCQQQTADVILLDYLLPDGDGLEFLQQLNQSLSMRKSAVIMLTEQGDESIAVRAMKSGVQDYLSKNYLTPEVLQGAIHHAVERVHLTRQLEQSRQQQQLMAAIALRIHQSLQLEEILAVTTAEVRQFLQVDRVVIYQFQPDMSGTIVAESIVPGWTVAMGVKVEDNCFQQRVKGDYHQWKRRAIADIYQAGLTDCYLKLLERFEVKAVLCVPILVTNELWGLLIAHQCTTPRHWQSFELDLLDQLGVQIAIAIQQGSAYEQAQAELQERKRTEATFRESEQRFRQMADTAPVLIWMAGLDKLCYYFNKTWLDFTGKTLEQEAGDGWVQGVHPNDLLACLDIYFTAFDARQKFQMEYRLKRFDGEYRWILDTGTPRFTSEGEFLGYIGSCIDISERKQVEQALRRNEERLNLALDAAGMGNWEWNIPTGAIHWSPSLERLFGINPGSFNGKYETVVAMMHPDDRQRVLQAINRAVHEREEYNIEFRFIKPDGTPRWALGKGRVFYDQQGNPVRMSGVDVDITERKQVQVALQESEARFQTFMNHSPAVAWITNEHGQIVYLSQTYFRTLQLPGETPEDVIGKTAFDIYPAEIAQQIVNNIRHVVQTQQIQETIEQAPKRDGTLGDFLVYKFPLPRTTGESLVGGVAVDITDKIRAEQALQQLNQELETRVAERTAALQESEERWHLAVRGSNDGIWDNNIKTNEIFFSTRWEEMLGFTSYELSRSREGWSSRIHPEDHDRIIKVIADHLAHKTPFFQEEYRVQCKDGSYIWVLDRGQALWDEAGNAIRMSGSSTDITRRKQAEAELLEVSRLQQAILECTDYAIISLNSQGIIQSFNIAAQRMLGYTADEVIGRVTPEIFHDPKELKQEAERLSQKLGREIPPGVEFFQIVAQIESSYEQEWTYIRQDGSRFPVLLSIKVLYNLEGETIGCLGTAKDITQQKHLESQLRKNTANLATAQRIADMGSWEFDLQTQKIIWSEEVFRIFGYDPASGTPSYEELLQSTHPDDRDNFNFTVQQTIINGQPYQIESRFTRADGSLLHVLARGEAILNANGEPMRLFGIVQDITASKQVEEALRQSEHRYATLAEASPVAILRFDTAGNCIYVNERWSEMTGRPTHTALEKGWMEVLHPEDRDHLVFLFCCLQFTQWIESLQLKDDSRLLVEWSRLFKQGGFFRSEGRLVNSDGSIIWVYCQALPETNPSGNIIGHVGTLTDISDRKQFELEVIQNRDLREAIFNESADAIFLVDTDTQLIFDCNRRAVELFEASSKEELINIDGHTLQRHQFTPQELGEITEQLEQKSFWSQEIEYVTSKGNLFWGNLAAKQITVAGKVINLVRVSDISDRKKTIEQIQRSLEEKDTLLKEIHHRVKNNLQIISSLLRMQTRRTGDETTLMLFQESQNRVQSMALIHEQLYQSADICQIDFGDYIRSLTDNLFRSYGVSQRKITLNVETNGIKLTLDNAIPCGLMINELVSNCLKYAFPEQQQGNITICLEAVPENQIILIVKDNGVGIPETFDWQNSNTLGLRIVRNLTRQLKGNMILKRDRGTSFYIYFAQ
ncbi:PAS domain S-box protein [Nostoc sp. UHCC 0870]|uniref:PAS domain S-box protein n=1 Tax=Nostoc sp. UHCC 0870 TaxID=2914041 RepID=UPI001EDED7AB|nr:PAS domain S-box protein [Nostoc sp. UHCC 0870]UKP00201.1 PAS domain S-box protein [Nostoc sp. UHCC 0870]